MRPAAKVPTLLDDVVSLISLTGTPPRSCAEFHAPDGTMKTLTSLKTLQPSAWWYSPQEALRDVLSKAGAPRDRPHVLNFREDNTKRRGERAFACEKRNEQDTSDLLAV